MLPNLYPGEPAPDLEYAERRLGKVREHWLGEARKAVRGLVVKWAGHGRSGSATLTNLAIEECGKTLASALQEMAGFLAETRQVMPCFGASMLKDEGQRMSDELASLVAGTTRAPQTAYVEDEAESPLTELARSTFARRITDIVDDYEHGHVSLPRGPVVPSVTIGTVNNTGQFAIGDKNRLTLHHNDIAQTLDAALAAPDVVALADEHRQKVANIAKVIKAEAGKPEGEASDARWWTGELVKFLRDVGAGVSAAGIAKALGLV